MQLGWLCVMGSMLLASGTLAPIPVPLPAVQPARPTLTRLPVPAVSLQELVDPSSDTIIKLQRAIAELGMFAVTQPEAAAEHARALHHLVGCIQSGAAGSHAQDVVLKDQTVRTTLAAATNASRSQPFSDDLRKQCPEFVAASDSLRAAAAATGAAYSKFLDRMGVDGPLIDGEPGPFQAAVTGSESLEHFHLFRRPAQRQAPAAPALRMHTDLGLFIVMTPPQHYSLADMARTTQAVEAGFRLQLPSGEVVVPEFPAGSLLVMNGEGSRQWVPSPVAGKLYVPPHEVVLPELAGLGRAWYGRMYLPPRTAQKADGKGTFNQYWSEGTAAVIKAPEGQVEGADCSTSSGHRGLLVDQGNCSVGSLYCWMGCRPITNVSTCPIQDIVCTDPNGLVWPDNFINATTGQPTHCFSCQLRCNSNAAVTTSPAALLGALMAIFLVQTLVW